MLYSPYAVNVFYPAMIPRTTVHSIDYLVWITPKFKVSNSDAALVVKSKSRYGKKEKRKHQACAIIPNRTTLHATIYIFWPLIINISRKTWFI